MIRKIVLATAIAFVPVASVVTVGLSGVASAHGSPPAAVTCVLGGTVTFPTGGLSQDGNYGNKNSSSTSALTSSSTGCSGSTVSLAAKDAKCKDVTTGNITVSGITVYPDTQFVGTLPGCAANSKTTEDSSIWGFGGGVLVNGVVSSAASAIPAELKKGVPFTDNGTAYTLLVSSAVGITPGSGSACGTSEVGFALSGTVKKYSTVSWNANICLGTDTTTGTGTSGGTFYSDLVTIILDTGNLVGPGASSATNPNLNITSASVDTADSTLTIS